MSHEELRKQVLLRKPLRPLKVMLLWFMPQQCLRILLLRHYLEDYNQDPWEIIQLVGAYMCEHLGSGNYKHSDGERIQIQLKIQVVGPLVMIITPNIFRKIVQYCSLVIVIRLRHIYSICV